jgi:Ni/Fe-hydrogenase subunit HybB-like protein
MTVQPPSTRWTLALGVLALAGVVAFVVGVGQSGVRTWSIFLINLLFWTGLAATGPAIAGIMELMQARWSPSVKRIALTTAGFLPVSFVLFFVLFFGRAALYPWVATPALVEVKAIWLNVPFMAARIGLGTLVLYAVTFAFVRAVLREREGEPNREKGRRSALAVVMLMLYVAVLSLFGFDLIMSLTPLWYSSLFGGYFVVTSLYTGFSLLAVLTVFSNRTGATSVPPAAVQDVAKLVFATCILSVYFFFSQYLVIWYGNVPVETRFLTARFFQDPWRALIWVVFAAGWLIPFCYLLKRLTGRPPQRHGPLLFVTSLGLVAIFIERMILVFPSVLSGPSLPIGWSEILITAGFFALFVLSRIWFLARYRANL